MITAAFHRWLLFALAHCPLMTFARYRADTSDPAGTLWVVSDERIMRWDNGRFALAQEKGVDGSFRAAIWNPQVFFGIDETR